MRIVSSTKRVLSLALFVPIIAFGQASIKGTVTDASNNETLIGANVIVEGTSLGAATDIEGQFRIVGIPERTFNIKISYVGYEPKILEIDFSKTKDVQKNIQMKPQIIQGEEVVVTAQMRGQLAAINQQITSNRIVSVVSEEKIKELPDANAAEAIGRLPGVSIIRSGGEATNVVMRGLSSKFSNITIDGVKIPPTDANSRDVDLSMMSQGALAGIELYKTLTPDQDADAIAGGINMVTRKAPSERLIRLDLKGSYNQLMKSANQYDLALRYGERFFDDILGVQLEGNVEKKIRSQENVSTSYNTTDNQSLPSSGHYNIDEYDNDYSIKASPRQFTNETRQRNGMQAILDFNTPDSGTVKLTGVYAFTNRNYITFERQYAGTWGCDFQNIDQNMVTRNGSLQGKNYLLGLTVDWNGSYAESKVTNPTNFRTMFYGIGTNPPSPIKDHPEQLNSLADNDFTKASLDSMDRYKIENFDKELTGQLNLTKSVTLWNMFTNEIKVGVKYKEKSRWLDNFGFAWNTYQDAPFLDSQGNPIDFSGTPFAGTKSHVQLSRFVDMANIPTRNLLGLYTLAPIIDVGTYQLFQNMVQNSTFTASINYGTIGATALSNYFITERVSSAYFMDNVDIGRSVSLEFGVRMEQERNNYLAHYGTNGAAGTGNVITISQTSIVDTATTYEKTLWLPNVQLTLRPADFLTLRFAAYQALARPDFSWRLPQLDVTKASPLGGGGSTSGTYTNITVGNPQLEDASATNYEMDIQIFGNTIGLLSVAAYYKRIDNMFHQTNAAKIEWPANDSTQTMIKNGVHVPLSDVGFHRLDELIPQLELSQWLKTPAFANLLHNDKNFTISVPYNCTNPSYAWGFELEHQFNFHFLPVKWLQNITLSYNVSIARSETYFFMEKAVIDTQFNAAQYSPKGKLIQDSAYVKYTDHTVILVKKPMEDQPQLFGNAVLGYDIGGLSARISVFYQSRYTRSYSVDGTNDAVVGEFIKWDLSLKQQITQKISLALNIDNLFNKSENRYRYNNVFAWGYLPTQSYLYGRTLALGVRVSL
jgi:TonB-dependent receptor